ncbi:MAG: aminopeptidase P family protein [Candidatus Thermoplasmatota archaeon]|jgi:Xaa-Pro aminopeptidase|nr:aminopeptidase P family protein [Candidatus Thermoplasmatota archaeon]
MNDMISDRITALRELMKREGVQAYLVPSSDQHQSEYLPECWKRRKWLSGFTGSAGDVVVTMDKAGLWTDGRYFIQAEEQLKSSGIVLYKMGLPDSLKMEDWIASELKEGQKLGVDPKVLSMESASGLKRTLKEKGMVLHYIDSNLVDELWTDRPSPSLGPVEVLDVRYSGESLESKLSRIRKKMDEKGCTVHITGALDSIAWTLNMRGKDIEFNPVFISYLSMTKDGGVLFIDPIKLDAKSKKHLMDKVVVRSYSEFEAYLKELSEKEVKVWLDPKTTNKWTALKLEGKPKVHQERSPIVDLKSVKNEVELKGFRDSLVVDGVAMVRYFKWLRENVPKGSVTEISAATKLEELRKEGKHFVGLSFTTISGYKGHGAIIHYDPTPETDVELKSEGIYLVDSGGQYMNGTTDITRTMALGPPTPEQIDMFTRVLKGHIAIASLRFPKGFSGKQLDAFARKALWDAGKNYNHGTGHGIGHYLNVHEGPMGITPRDAGVPLSAGNVLSNEPGYYKENEYGIRTENLIVVVKDEEFSTPEQEFLRFETLTLCPIDLSLVDRKMLTKEERKWLNEYHRLVRRKLSRKLDPETRAFLKELTRKV